MGGFALLQVMFARLPPVKVKGGDSLIEEQFCKKKNKEFTSESKELLKFLCGKESLPRNISHMFGKTNVCLLIGCLVIVVVVVG